VQQYVSPQKITDALVILKKENEVSGSDLYGFSQTVNSAYIHISKQNINF